MPSTCSRHSARTIAGLILLLTACAPSPLLSRAQPTSAASQTRTRPSSSTLPSATTQSPTPQPTAGPDAYRLKTWTEQDALAAIQDGEKLEPTTNGQQPSDIRDYLLTLEREALLRFPQAQSKDEIEWKVARAAATLPEGESEKGTPVDSFASLLASALNSGQTAPETLEAWLPDKGFAVVSRQSAPNLFGDGQPVLVLQIKTDDPLVPGEILLTISQSPQSASYRLLSVRPSWRYYSSQSQIIPSVTVASHIGNDRPQIQTVAESDWPALCQSQLSLYVWKGDSANGHFENVAAQVKPVEGDYTNSECKDPWEFGTPDTRRIQPLMATLRYNNWAGGDCLEFEYKIRYEWDGAAYRWVSGGASLPDKSPSPHCAVGWAHAAAKLGLYDQAIPLVVPALADWPTELNYIWGSSAQDLFRFELGTWYAFQGNSDKAVFTIQDIASQPANPAFKMMPRVAQAFVSSYQVSNDPDAACLTVYNLLKQEFPQTPDNGRFASSSRTIAAWGFAEPDWLSKVPALEEVCSRGSRPDGPSNGQLPSATPGPAPQTPEPTAAPSPEQTQREAIDLIDKTLFVDRDPRQASQLIARLFAAGVIEPGYATTDVKPYLQYLLGLAYELSGDEKSAITSYWHVWHDYPDSLYSKIAQLKIQPISP